MHAGQRCPATLLWRTGTRRVLVAAQLADVFLLLTCFGLRAAVRGGAQASPIDDSIAAHEQAVSGDSQIGEVNRVEYYSKQDFASNCRSVRT